MLVDLDCSIGSVHGRSAAKEESLMRNRKFSVGLMALAVVVLTVFGAATRATAQQEIVLYDFGAGNGDGIEPESVVIFDDAGNLYGTTPSSIGEYGSVFELTPSGNGTWTENILHTFTKYDGREPLAGVIRDTAGNLYGTTLEGGTYGNGNFDGGTVFELEPAQGGGWTEKVLHSFGSGTDGFNPWGGLVMDSAGNLYGTTVDGGSQGHGVVFELSPGAGGNWTEKILHSFVNNGADGVYPYATLILDSAGNLYGTTGYGGAYACGNDAELPGCGTVFEMHHTAVGGFAEKVLHSFSNNHEDGIQPRSPVVLDGAGNLYGTTTGGGSVTTCHGYGCGTVFELVSSGGGAFAERVLYSFTDNGQDGYLPYAGLVLDVSGNLYGTASTGGNANSFAYGGGTVFELKSTGGIWIEKILHNFGAGTDGAYPIAGLTFDSHGRLYGTTQDGGPGGYGTAFEIKP
jgi:uncharacterized repeat protein (TIGR03803 family)